MDNRLRLSKYQEHQIEQIKKLANKEAMTSLVNPAYDSKVGSPTDHVNANTTTSSLTTTDDQDPIENEINKMLKENLRDMEYSLSDNKNEEVSIRSGTLGSGKSRTKYASTDYSSMGIGNPLENLPGAYSDDDYDDDEDDIYVEDEDDEENRRLTVADDNILRERNKIKAQAMFAGIDFIDDGEDDESEEEEDDDSDDKAEIVILEDSDSTDEKAPKRVRISENLMNSDGACSPKDPDADLVSPDDEVVATKLGGILSYYASLEAMAKQRAEQIEDDNTSVHGSVSDSDVDGESGEGLYEMPQQPTPFDSGPSTMDDESTDDCESTYEMLYKSFGLRSQEETFTKDLLSPSQGQPDHGYASETSADERVSPIKRPGLLARDGFKPPLGALTEDCRSDLPQHKKHISPSTEAESGIEVTPEPKSNKPLLDTELTDAQKSALTKPTTLPPGWREVADAHGTYYWHVPTGTTQWSPPSPTDSQASLSPPKKPARDQKQSHSRGHHEQDQDPSLKEFQKSTLRYASLKLGPSTSKEDNEQRILTDQNVRGIRFHVRSLGWVEMEDSDLSPGKSSLAVNNCIRQLSYRKNDIRDTAGIWGEGKDMYMVLEDEYLKLTDPNDSTVLNSQHVCSIRVWGVGRDNGRERDFAYVARDKVTKRYKCHVFRCDIPAKAIANALHEICAKVMSERQKGNTISMVTQGQMIRQQQQQQLMQMKSISLDSSKEAVHTPGVDFPTPKMEPITVFRANYIGSTSTPKQTGMEVLNDAIDKVIATVPEDQWTPVRIEVAVSTVTVTSVKTKEIIAENRIRFMSFLGIGKDSRHFAYIMCIGKNKYQCHIFCCEHSAGGLAKAVEAACKLRYQKCLDAHPKGSQISAADGKTWGCALKSGVQCIFNKLGGMRIQKQEAPISAV